MSEVVAWHWLDETTMMILTDDMVWHRLEGVYTQSMSFNGLEMSSTEDVTIIMPTTRYVTQATSDTPV